MTLAFPKPPRPERGTAETKRYMALVAQLPCCICGAHPVQLHHVSHGRFAQRRAGDFAVIPLCPKHHEFRTNRGETWAQMYGFDWEYVEPTKKAVEQLQRNTIGGR